MKKSLLLFIAALALSGCGTTAAATPNASASAAASPKASVWAISPRYLFHDVAEPVNDSIDVYVDYFSGYNTAANAKTGESYSPDAIFFRDNGLYGVMDYAGDILMPPTYSEMEFRDIGEGYTLYGSRADGGFQYESYLSNPMDAISIDYKTATPAVNPHWYAFDGDTAPIPLYDAATQQFYLLDGDEGAYAISEAVSPADPSGSWIFERSHVFRMIDHALTHAYGCVITDDSGKVVGQIPDEVYHFGPVANGMLAVTQSSQVYDYSQYPFKMLDGVRFRFYSIAQQAYIDDFAYENVKYFTDHICAVEKDGKWGYINDQGAELTDFAFDDAMPAYQSKAFVKYNGKWGVLNISEDSGHITADMLSGYDDAIADPAAAPNPAGAANPIIGSIIPLVDGINIRTAPSTSAGNDPYYSQMSAHWPYPVMEFRNAEGYDWARIGIDQWVATKEGEWTTFESYMNQ